MSDEELVNAAQNGDNIALEAILLRYKNLVCARAKSYYLAGADEDDMIQEGLIGLYNAVRKFDGRRFPFFKVFALVCVKRRMLSAVKEASRKKHRPLNSYVSLDAPTDTTDEEAPLSEVIAAKSTAHDPEALFIDRESLNSVENKISRTLSSFELDVLMLYLEDRSYREIAHILKKDEKSVDNAIQRIKKKLRYLKEH